MDQALDPRELKILSDILALVLEEQPGQSASALEALRARARKNEITGGALKNLFVAIGPNPPARAPRPSRAKAATTPDAQASRTRIAKLTEEMNRLDVDLRTSRARIDALRRELQQTQAARADAQSQLALMLHRRGPARRLLIGTAFVVGVLGGVAGAQVWHNLEAPVAAEDAARGGP